MDRKEKMRRTNRNESTNSNYKTGGDNAGG